MTTIVPTHWEDLPDYAQFLGPDGETWTFRRLSLTHSMLTDSAGRSQVWYATYPFGVAHVPWLRPDESDAIMAILMAFPTTTATSQPTEGS